MLTWRRPARQRSARGGGRVCLSATECVRSRVREEKETPGWARWAQFSAGLDIWRAAFFLCLFLFFFYSDFLGRFSNEIKFNLNSNFPGIFAVSSSLKNGHKTMGLLCKGLVKLGDQKKISEARHLV